MSTEIDEMMDILLGRQAPPIDVGPLTLMEISEAFHARACEMEMHLKDAESEGFVLKGSSPYKFRTGKLRTFIELCKRTVDLGSRRITVVQMEHDEIYHRRKTT